MPLPQSTMERLLVECGVNGRRQINCLWQLHKPSHREGNPAVLLTIVKKSFPGEKREIVSERERDRWSYREVMLSSFLSLSIVKSRSPQWDWSVVLIGIMLSDQSEKERSSNISVFSFKHLLCCLDKNCIHYCRQIKAFLFDNAAKVSVHFHVHFHAAKVSYFIYMFETWDSLAAIGT